MKRPTIDFVFQTAAKQTLSFGEKGVLALILRDDNAPGAHTVWLASQIPAMLTASNQDIISLALMGYITTPKRVLIYVIPTSASDLSEALEYFGAQDFDYLIAPPDASEAEVDEIQDWILLQRTEKHLVKAVLPNCPADSEAIVNFTGTGMHDENQGYTTAQYCARIGGILAGTPWTMSATFALLPELTAIDRLTNDEADAAIDSGQLILLHDGRKAKIARAVNSFQTTSSAKGEIFKKIKIVEVIDRISADLTAAIEDGYIGRYTNSYDNKMLLVAACRQYFYDLETAGIVQSGSSSVDLNTEAIRAYLEEHGTDTSDMDENALRQADTGSHVFLEFWIKILDAIEDVHSSINL